MRIFTFGCSLTQYFYPTWADITISHFENEHGYTGYNWGRSGAGNQFIATRIWEANAVYKFKPGDLILIQWSSMFREDRYHEDHGWYCPGGFNTNRLKDQVFELNGFQYEDQQQWADFLHCALRDCALISSTRKALDSLGCTVCSTGFRDFFEGYEYFDPIEEATLLVYENLGAILDYYKDDIETELPPILNALDFGLGQDFFKSRPYSVPSLDKEWQHLYLPEIHPLPKEHLKFVTDFVLPFLDEDNINSKTLDFVEKYHNKVKDKDPIVLKDLKWANVYQMGFSDDGRRP